jgi:hypothetical protein
VTHQPPLAVEDADLELPGAALQRVLRHGPGARGNEVAQRLAPATVFAPAMRAASAASATSAPSAPKSASPRLECRSSRPWASFVIFATPPASVSRGTGWRRRYFSSPPTKSPISISATSGRACSACTARSEVEPVLPAMCAIPMARATSTPRWMESIQAAQE